MTLANMRAQGVCSLSVTGEPCHHEAAMNVARFGDVAFWRPLRRGDASRPHLSEIDNWSRDTCMCACGSPSLARAVFPLIRPTPPDGKGQYLHSQINTEAGGKVPPGMWLELVWRDLR
jgi:hypothetical protein